jgi:hypothetical protein
VDFRLSYGAMLAVMTSEYVEKAPMHDAEVTPIQKRAAIIATPQSAKVLEAQVLAEKLRAIGFEVSSKPTSGATALFASEDRGIVGQALQWAAAKRDRLIRRQYAPHDILKTPCRAEIHLSPESIVLWACASKRRRRQNSRIAGFLFNGGLMRPASANDGEAIRIAR